MRDTSTCPPDEPRPTLNLIRYHIGQAALNILIRPDDAPSIDRELDRAARIARAYARESDCQEPPERLRRLIADGHVLRSIHDRHNLVPAEPHQELQEEHPEESDDGNLVWVPTTDGYGYTATRGETVYVVHTAGPKPMWRCGVGDGSITEWLDQRFHDEESARSAAQALSGSATSS